MKTRLMASANVSQKKLPAKVAVGMLAVALSPTVVHAAETQPAENVKTLETVKVTAEQPTRGSYKAEVTEIGKMKQKLKDIPQSVSVVTHQLIADQGDATLKEALKNVLMLGARDAELRKIIAKL